MPAGSSSGVSRNTSRSSAIGNTRARAGSTPVRSAEVAVSAASATSEAFSNGATRRHRAWASSAPRSRAPFGVAMADSATGADAQPSASATAAERALQSSPPVAGRAFCESASGHARAIVSRGAPREGSGPRVPFTVPSHDGHQPVTAACVKLVP